MGIKNSKIIIGNNKHKISKKLYNLFTKESLFYKKTKPCFIKLATIIYEKEITLKNKENIENLSIQEYINLKKLINAKNEINKNNFLKLISIFSFKEIDNLLRETKKELFEQLRKEYETKKVFTSLSKI